MPDILIDFVVELEEVSFVMFVNAFFADVKVGLHFGLIALIVRFYLAPALVAFEVQHPLVVGFPQLIADAEQPETQVVVASEYLDLLLALEDHLDD